MVGLGRTFEAEQLARIELLKDVLGVETAGLYGQVVQAPLLVGLVQDVLLDRTLTDQAVDVHLPRLPDAVAAVLCL